MTLSDRSGSRGDRAGHMKSNVWSRPFIKSCSCTKGRTFDPSERRRPISRLGTHLEALLQVSCTPKCWVSEENLTLHLVRRCLTRGRNDRHKSRPHAGFWVGGRRIPGGGSGNGRGRAAGSRSWEGFGFRKYPTFRDFRPPFEGLAERSNSFRLLHRPAVNQSNTQQGITRGE
jgi:hypothetical protein